MEKARSPRPSQKTSPFIFRNGEIRKKALRPSISLCSSAPTMHLLKDLLVVAFLVFLASVTLTVAQNAQLSDSHQDGTTARFNLMMDATSTSPTMNHNSVYRSEALGADKGPLKTLEIEQKSMRFNFDRYVSQT